MSFFKKLFATFTGKERRTLIITTAILAICLIAIIAIVVIQTTKSVPAAGGSFTEGMVGQPEYVNPVTAQSKTDESLVKLVYANLPTLASSITSSPDNKTWTVRLKENLTWQDGQQLTSDDVIFTVQSIQNSNANSPLAAAWQGVTVSRNSEIQLTFTLPKPYAFFQDNLNNLYIIPKHIFANVPPGNWSLSEYNLRPIGSGPYKFSSYDRQNDGFISGYHLSAWNSYTGKIALIQNFNIAFFPNQTAVIQNFNNGTIDGFEAVPSDLAAVARPANVATWRTSDYYAVFWNQGNNNALTDPAVRAALAEAVDRNAVTAKALTNYGEPDESPVPPDAPYAIAINTTTSLELASETLSNDGWQINSSGILQKIIQKATTTLSFTLTVPDVDFLVTTAHELQSAWQSIGAQVTIATDTPANIAANQAKNRDYDALLYGNVLGANSDLYPFWDSNEQFDPGLNFALYNNPTDDQLMASIETSLNDASRTAMFAKLQNDIASANAALFLYSTDDLYVTTKNVHGIDTNMPLVDPSDRFYQVPQWYLNTTRVLK